MFRLTHFSAADTFSSGGKCTVGILLLSFQIIDLPEIARRAREAKKKTTQKPRVS
jgi:hypothetical protein